MKEVRGKKARSRMYIMHAAKELFEEKGINHVTFNDIADRAGMCRTTIFNHFATINDLMLALLDQEVEDLLEYSEDSRLEGWELIQGVFSKLIEDTANYPALASKLIARGIISEQKRSSLRQIEDLIWDNLEEEDDERREHIVVLLLGSYYGLINHYFINNYEFDKQKMKKDMDKYVGLFYRK